MPPRALDMPMNCSSGISNLVEFLFCLLTWLTFLLDGRILFHCTFILMILTFTASSTCLFTWDLSCPGECFLCVVILKNLGCFTSTGFTVGWTRVFATCSLDTVLRFSPTADCRYCVSSTCCVIFGTLTIFSNTCGFCTSMICSTTRLGSWDESFHWHVVNNFNDLFHRAILHALFVL